MSANPFSLSEPLPAVALPETGSRQRRLIPVLYGLMLLLWTSLEDNAVLPVALLGGGLAFLIIQQIAARTLTERQTVLAAALVGMVVGLGATLATALLMLIKDGMHSHVFPDYPFGMITDLLARAPLWALAGMFAGIGLLLVRRALRA